MSAASHSKSGDAKTAFGRSAKPSARKRTSISPLTLRLTPEERVRLEELAAGITPSAYVRACVFADDAKLRKTRPKTFVEDKKAFAGAG